MTERVETLALVELKIVTDYLLERRKIIAGIMHGAAPSTDRLDAALAAIWCIGLIDSALWRIENHLKGDRTGM